MRIAGFKLLVCTLLLLALIQGPAFAAVTAQNQELKLDELQVGAETYKNVTVTSRGKDYVFITHAKGMTSVKLSDLSEETRLALGYAPPPKPKSQVAMEKIQQIQTMEVPTLNEEQARQLEEKLNQAFGPGVPPILELNKQIKPWMVLAFFAVMLFAYWFFCYCSMLICKKAGHEPGVLVWLPIVQFIPLIRAAGMSPLWFLGFLIPLVNIVAQVIWCFKIAQARGKGPLTAIMLLLPLTNILAYMYLAFSQGSQQEERSPRAGGRPALMTLSAT